MKILILSAADSIHTVRWVNKLSERGHEVHLIYNKNHSPTIHEIDNNVVQHRLKFSGNIGYFLNKEELKKIVKNISPDVINAHYASGYGTLARMAKLSPLVLSVWGSDVYDFPYQNKWKMKLIKKNLDYANEIASTSISMAKQVEKIMGKDMNIIVTPFGVDIEKFKPNNQRNDEIIFGVVKTLLPKYGIQYIIGAFNILVKRLEKEGMVHNVKLEIYGKGNMEENLKALCNKYSITEKVLFKGYIPNVEVPRVLNSIDVFCLGSVLDSESFGVAAVEAMACEVPIIATDVSGFKEVVVNEEVGYIVPKENEEQMAEKMYDLTINSTKRREMGKKGRSRVIQLYDWEKNVDTMEGVYYKLKMEKDVVD